MYKDGLMIDVIHVHRLHTKQKLIHLSDLCYLGVARCCNSGFSRSSVSGPCHPGSPDR